MNPCLETLDQFGAWEDDLEIEALPSVQSASVFPLYVYIPGWLHGPLTTLVAPPSESIYTAAV